MRRTLRYGGTDWAIDADEDRALVDVVRGELGARSCNRGCKNGTCGSCRVLVDGVVVTSCLTEWKDVRDGAAIETHESLADDEGAKRAVDAFDAERPTRCKLCVGALAVTAASLARAGKRGDEDAIEVALRGATCMCTGRGSWRRALLK